jgi:hypothetical protein
MSANTPATTPRMIVSVVETVVEAVRIIQTAMMTTAIDVRDLRHASDYTPAQHVCEVLHTHDPPG